MTPLWDLRRGEDIATSVPPVPPEVIAFEATGTVFSLTSLEPLVEAADGDASTAEQWFSRLLADGFALTAAREYQPFREWRRPPSAPSSPDPRHATACWPA